MSVYGFNFPTAVRFGIGAIDELPAYLKANGISRPLLVTDELLLELGFVKKIVQQLQAAGISPVLYAKLHKNPVKGDVLGGVEVFHSESCDGIVGLGGGVPMDVARAIALKAHHPRDLFDYEDASGGWQHVTEEIPHFVTVPTTSGTGSEVGRSTVISDDVTHQKKILFSPRLMAKMVFADPALTFDMPPAVTAATGMDAFTHNLEAFLAKGYHPMADGMALEGIRLVGLHLENAVNKPTPEARTQMMAASMIGATAFQKGLGVVHSLAHPLSTLFDTHHGLANAVMLQYGMAFNLSGFEDRFERIAQALQLENASPEGVIAYLRELNGRLGLPSKLSDLGVEEKHVGPLSELALADACHPSNPKPVSLDDFRRLYTEAIG